MFLSNRTNNPFLRRGFPSGTTRPTFAADRMTVEGTINKTGILLVVLLLGALYPWTHPVPALDTGCMLTGLIGGFVLAIITSFKAQWSAALAPPYALLEGLALGGLSALFELRYPGIAIESVLLTFATLGIMLVAYRTGLIHVTQRFRTTVFAATGAIALLYFMLFVLSFFHISMSFISAPTPLGIVISLVIIVVAALNLALDFDMIENGARNGAPRYMEWYSSFALIVTLVWLYMEILRLVTQLRRE